MSVKHHLLAIFASAGSITAVCSLSPLLGANMPISTPNGAVYMVALVGGPCAGKSTALSKAVEYAENRGYVAALHREVATELILSGLPPSVKWIGHKVFQTALLRYMIFRENLYVELLSKIDTNKPKVLFCDRGALDAIAYVGRGAFMEVAEDCGTSIPALQARYDLVVHLVTAADGAEEFYTLENNAARSEGLELARQLDQKVREAWVGSNHFQVIDNSTDFHGKLGRVLTSLARVLGMPEPIERERKFRVLNWSKKLLPNYAVRVDIVQTYLCDIDGTERRVRQRTVDGVSHWTYTEKKDTDKVGERIETERQIERSEYERLLEDRDPKSVTIYKARYYFPVGALRFEVDVYIEPRPELVILEVEVPSMDTPIPFPEGWSVIELTGNKDYSNRQIALSSLK